MDNIEESIRVRLEKWADAYLEIDNNKEHLEEYKQKAKEIIYSQMCELCLDFNLPQSTAYKIISQRSLERKLPKELKDKGYQVNIKEDDNVKVVEIKKES